MIDFRQALKKAGRLDLSDWRRLGLLVIGAFLLGGSWALLDVASVSLFLKKNIFHAIGIDFFAISFCFVFVGIISVKLDRRHGYGGVPLTAFLTFVLFLVLYWMESFPEPAYPVHFLFVYKYILPVLISISFWTIAGRFIPLKLNSLKYLGVLAASLLGIYCGGLILSHYDWTEIEALKGCLFGLIGLAIVMKILVWLLPMPSETFIPKTGGVQDVSEQKMIDCILMLSFTYMVARGLGDYLLYRHLNNITELITTILSRLWMFCGLGGFLVLAILSCTRFLYTTLWGLFTLSFGFFFLGEGAFLELPWMLYMGVVISWIGGYLYWGPYLSLLPRPLTLGEGIRLRKMRQTMIEPLGFVLVGAFVLSLPKFLLAPILMGLALLLMGLIWLSVSLYSHLLLRLCKMRFWCGGPLMIVSNKLVNYVYQGLRSDSAQEVIYFLRIMEIAYFPGYLKCLLKTLHHPDAQARLFALDKLENFIKKKHVIKEVRSVFQKDKDVSVRARALAILIHFEGENNAPQVYNKFSSYLDNKGLKAGAILGFLQIGGENALLAMDGLQRMVLSPLQLDNLMALKIIDKVPQQGLVRLVLPLLKSQHVDVVRAALLTAGRIGHAQSLSYVFQSLDNPQLQEEALQALKMYGKKAFPPLEKMLKNPHVPFERQKKLILFLGALSSGEGKQILLRNLYSPDQMIRKEVFSAILNSKIIWVSNQRKKILKQGIEQDVQWWYALGKNISLCEQPPIPALGDSFSFLRRSFQEMHQDIRNFILDQLLLLNSSALVRKAVRLLRGKPDQNFTTAIGILQDLLPAKIYTLIKPVLLDSPEDLDKTDTSMDLNETRKFLEGLIITPSVPRTYWMIASALYGLQKIGDKDSMVVLSTAFNNSHSVVLDAALDLLIHLESDRKEQDKFLQNILQTPPRNFVLENYLKKRTKK